MITGACLLLGAPRRERERGEKVGCKGRERGERETSDPSLIARTERERGEKQKGRKHVLLPLPKTEREN